MSILNEIEYKMTKYTDKELILKYSMFCKEPKLIPKFIGAVRNISNVYFDDRCELRIGFDKRASHYSTLAINLNGIRKRIPFNIVTSLINMETRYPVNLALHIPSLFDEKSIGVHYKCEEHNNMFFENNDIPFTEYHYLKCLLFDVKDDYDVNVLTNKLEKYAKLYDTPWENFIHAFAFIGEEKFDALFMNILTNNVSEVFRKKLQKTIHNSKRKDFLFKYYGI